MWLRSSGTCVFPFISFYGCIFQFLDFRMSHICQVRDQEGNRLNPSSMNQKACMIGSPHLQDALFRLRLGTCIFRNKRHETRRHCRFGEYPTGLLYWPLLFFPRIQSVTWRGVGTIKPHGCTSLCWPRNHLQPSHHEDRCAAFGSCSQCAGRNHLPGW